MTSIWNWNKCPIWVCCVQINFIVLRKNSFLNYFSLLLLSFFIYCLISELRCTTNVCDFDPEINSWSKSNSIFIKMWRHCTQLLHAIIIHNATFSFLTSIISLCRKRLQSYFSWIFWLGCNVFCQCSAQPEVCSNVLLVASTVQSIHVK